MEAGHSLEEEEASDLANHTVAILAVEACHTDDCTEVSKSTAIQHKHATTVWLCADHWHPKGLESVILRQPTTTPAEHNTFIICFKIQ